MATITVAELLESMRKHAEVSRRMPNLSPLSYYRHQEVNVDPRIRQFHTVVGMSYYAWSTPDQYKIVGNNIY